MSSPSCSSRLSGVDCDERRSRFCRREEKCGRERLPEENYIIFNEYSNSYCMTNSGQISGVAWLIRSGNKSSFCMENRVALTKDEQKAIGDSQPFMLEDITYDPSGKVIEDSILVDSYNKKMSEKNMDIAITAEQAKEYKTQFSDRHFPMAILRESVKKSEHPVDALKRGLREECKKRFKDDSFVPTRTFYYERGLKCILVYFIDADMLETDPTAVEKKGRCNYFCAKSLKGVVDNDYLETKEHQILDNDVIEQRLLEFERKFGEKGIGCDLKYWGGLKMWNKCKEYF